MAYSVRFREEGRGPWTTRKFKTLAALQEYVRDRWQGPDYIEGPKLWHTDYTAFELGGAVLTDLGSRMGSLGTDAYYDWQWKDLSNIRPADKQEE